VQSDSDAKSCASWQDDTPSATEVAAVPTDAYGDVIVSFVWLMRWKECLGLPRLDPSDPLSPQQHPRFWMLTSFIVYVANLLFQFCLSFMVFTDDLYNAQSWSFFDMLLDSNHSIWYQIAELASSTTLLPDSNRTSKHCLSNHVDILWAYPVVLFLWISRMLQEIAESVWLMIVLLRVCPPDAEEPTANLSCASSHVLRAGGTSAKPSYLIVGTSGILRHTLLLVISLPKLVLGIWVTWVGCKFLILTRTTGTLVLKSVALQWFVMIDELLFKSYMSEQKKDLMKKTSIAYRSFKDDTWATYGNTVARMSIVLLLHSTIYYGVFRPINEFRSACRDYKIRNALIASEPW